MERRGFHRAMRKMQPETNEPFDDDLDAQKRDFAEETAKNMFQEVSKASADDEMITLKKSEYEKLKRDLAEAQDRGLRALADLENYRARTNRLQAEERKYASMDLARAILPVWDNLNLALQIEEPEKNGAAVIDGVKMVCHEFLRVFASCGIEKINALHQPFDPNFHESVAFLQTDEFPPNTVVAELKTGFTLADRVVRATQVALATPKPENKAAEE